MAKEDFRMVDFETKAGKIMSIGDVTIKSSKDGKRLIKGLANANTVDRSNQRIEPTAFAASMTRFMSNPVMFLNHSWNIPVGKVVDFSITPEGLEITGEIGEGWAEADLTWSMIEGGAIRAFSVGLRPEEIEEDDKGVEIITSAELLEVSVVGIPMNAESLFDIAGDGSLKGIRVVVDEKEMTYEELCKSNEPAKIDMVVTEEAAEAVEEKSVETTEETLEVIEDEVEVKVEETEEVELKEEETEEVELELKEETTEVELDSDEIELKEEVDTDALLAKQEVMVGLVQEATDKLSSLNDEVETLKAENLNLQEALKTFISDSIASASKSLFRR